MKRKRGRKSTEPGHGPLLGTGLAVRPSNPYAVTKACGEIIARYYSETCDSK